MQAKVDTMPGVPAVSSGGKPKTVKMAAKLAYRNLFHDRLSLVGDADRHRVLGGARRRAVRPLHRF